MAPVYLLDACVLYPVVVRDLLLTLATFDAFEARWTAEIIGEMSRNVLADHHGIDPATFDQRIVGSMRRAFPEALVSGYEHLIDGMDNHPKDRHVAAAAIHIVAAAIVTYNVRDFVGERLRTGQIEILTPPGLVARLASDEPSVVALAIQAIRPAGPSIRFVLRIGRLRRERDLQRQPCCRSVELRTSDSTHPAVRDLR